MKKLIFLTTCAAFFAITGTGQTYTTPGAGVNWNLDSLVVHSGGVVTATPGGYNITGTLNIDTSDLVSVSRDGIITLDSGAFLRVQSGTLVVDPPVSVVLTASDTLVPARYFRGMQFQNSPGSRFVNTTVQYGGGILISGSDMLFDSCIFRNNSRSYQSAVISIATGGGKPVIRNSIFTGNERSAIGSGSNVDAAPVIRNNIFTGNVTDNTNRPQINLGPSGATDTVYITGNTLTGDPASPMSGGIGISVLLSGAANAVIDSNVVTGNRYGIAAIGANIFTLIRHNRIRDNNIQNDPILGGSGINFQSAGGNNRSVVTGNEISGNLWGITIIGQAAPNLGDTNAATFNPGRNIFENNGNGGTITHLFNNTPLPVSAMNNCWNTAVFDSASIEDVISHFPDIDTLGLVTFMPAWDCDSTTLSIPEDVSAGGTVIYPNPASGTVTISVPSGTESYTLQVMNAAGQLVRTLYGRSGQTRFQLGVGQMQPGVFYIRITGNGKAETRKLIVL